jgi:hypothetical protein
MMQRWVQQAFSVDISDDEMAGTGLLLLFLLPLPLLLPPFFPFQQKSLGCNSRKDPNRARQNGAG